MSVTALLQNSLSTLISRSFIDFHNISKYSDFSVNMEFESNICFVIILNSYWLFGI